jgi:prepilin-type N-terminal cleavage/methylation domain-containing protein
MTMPSLHVAKNRRTPEHISGFTLVEVLLALSIGAAVVLIVSQTFLLASRTNDRQESALHVSADGRGSLLFLARTIRSADSITTPLPGESSPELVLETASGPVTFSTTDGALWMTADGESSIRLSGRHTTISDLEFQRADGGQDSLIGVVMTISSDKKDGTDTPLKTTSFRTSFALRAE